MLDADAGHPPTSSRLAWFGDVEVATPVHDWEQLGSGAAIDGPAFVESPQTTVVVHPGQRATIDAGGNLTLITAVEAQT